MYEVFFFLLRESIQSISGEERRKSGALAET